jgi:hypothetical protein
MDHMSVGRVFLILMLLSETLGNSLFCTSQAKDLLFQNLSPSMFEVQPILWTLLGKKKKNIWSIVLGRTKTKNSLGNGGGHSMAY